MKTRPKFTIDEIENHDEGICLACGDVVHGVEPDARNRECEVCGARKVFGLEEAVIMGAIDIADDE